MKKPQPRGFDFYLPPLASILNEQGEFIRPGNTFPDFQGTLEELVDWIKYNPRRERIEYLRSQTYKSDEYIRVKNQELMYLTPHCKVHTYRENKNVKYLTGILYFDADDKKIKEKWEIVDDFIAAVIAEGSDIVSVVGKSVGGSGAFIYLQVEGLTVDNFDILYEHFRTEVLGKLPCLQDKEGGCILDINAKGIVRPQLVTYDSNIYFNDIKLTVDNCLLQKPATRYSYINKKSKKEDLHRLAGFIPYPMNVVLKALRQRTYVDTGGKDYLVEKRSIVKLWVHRIIPAGKRRKYFATYTNILTYINPDAPLETIFSFIYNINQERTCGCPMPQRDLERVVIGTYNYTKANGLFNKAWETGKYIHLSDEFRKGRSRKEICTKANQLNGELKISRTTNKIKSAIDFLLKKGRKVTAVAISEVSGLSERTVRTYYKKKRLV